MADNTILPIGTQDGDTYASDDISGVKFQRVKVTLGADGTNAGDVSATNPMPIDGSVSVSGSVTVSGPLTDAELRADRVDVALDDGSGNKVTIHDLATQPTDSDYGIVTHSMIHGHTTAGGGSFVDVKVNPSGALTVDATQSGIWTVDGPLTDTELRATAVPVDASGTTVPVSGPLTDAQLRASAVPVDASGTTVPVDVQNASLAVTGTFWQATQPVSGTVTADAGSGTFATKETRSGTATTTQVADTASSTTLLASNANRLGASIQNDSSAVLYVKCGTTASATDYSARLVQYGYYEVPANYTGRIDGIWATDPGDGAARITEFT